MGIRFRCPNGHKIHVKQFLAGKRGICPECGSKVPIPLESDPEFLPEATPSRQGASSAAAPNASVASRRATDELDRRGSPRRPQDTSGEMLDSPSLAELEPRDAAGARKASRTTGADPVAESREARWYVRPSSGGQFGPAPGRVFQTWLDEGRVAPDAYVWREGWAEWQRADSVFDKLGAAKGGPSDVVPLPEIVTSRPTTTAAELYRRRRSNKMTVTVVGLLVLACAVLFAALVYVVRFMD